MAKINSIGFGFLEKETSHHFLIKIPRSKNKDILIYERFKWDDSEEQSSDITEENLKVIISYEKWEVIKLIVEKEFNRRLSANNMYVCKFKAGDIPLERLLGKELILLLWAIEDSDPGLIPVAIKNWLGLSQEERWWLFTMTNANSGNYGQKRGWRIAIRYALTENPVDDNCIQGNLMEILYRKM